MWCGGIYLFNWLFILLVTLYDVQDVLKCMLVDFTYKLLFKL